VYFVFSFDLGLAFYGLLEVLINFFYSEEFNLLVYSAVQSVACFLIHAGFLLGLVFSHEDGGDMFLRNVPVTFRGLHSNISQKI
jgi:hypothetical protein